jgi:hypothetical protein
LTKIKSTPGPWQVPGTPIAMVYGPKGERICRLIDRDSDAFLISAAPELLDACRRLLSFPPEDWPMPLGYSQIVQEAKQAIAKATNTEQ